MKNFFNNLWLKTTVLFSNVYEKAKEIIIGSWTKLKPTLNRELMKLAKSVVVDIAENRKDLVGKDDERRHAAQDLFKKKLKENSELTKENLKDSLVNALLEMAVVEIKF